MVITVDMFIFMAINFHVLLRVIKFLGVVFFHFITYRMFSVIRLFSLQNNPKNLDPSYKVDLDLWDCLVKLIAKFYGTDLLM